LCPTNKLQNDCHFRAEPASGKELNQKLKDLESALEQALYAVQTLGPMAEKKSIVLLLFAPKSNIKAFTIIFTGGLI
jgi:hypothetical protein